MVRSIFARLRSQICPIPGSAALEQQRTLLDLQARAYSLNVALIESLGGGYVAPATTYSLTRATLAAQPAGENP